MFVANSGTCPDPTSVGGICGNFCLRDSDCQSLGNRKCCSNGCGFNCVDPIYNALPTRFPNPNDPCSVSLSDL